MKEGCLGALLSTTFSTCARMFCGGGDCGCDGVVVVVTVGVRGWW